METGGFRDRGVETGRFRDRGVETGRFRDRGVEMGRFRGIFKDGGVGCLSLDLVFCSEDHLQ